MTAVMCALLAVNLIAQPDAIRLSCQAPCSVFFEGEELRFVVAVGDAEGVEFRAVDYDGDELWRGRTQGGELVLPELPDGYYELHWGADGRLSFAVIPPREEAPPPDGPLCVDGATAWLCSPEQWEPVARMLRRGGIGWMRERLAWSAVQPEESKLDWSRYETVADALHAEDVREYQIFHDSPQWTHPGKDTRCPDDLRTVYRFTKEAASHFAGRIAAWEPWNEPDISFFDQLGDRYAGLQKAAYLGFKAGNPGVPVLTCSFCRGRSDFSDNVFECGIADYADVFNFHTYSPIVAYADTIRTWTDLASTYGMGDRPIWLTEAGIAIRHTDQELKPEDERTQAEFVPRSFAISLAGGVDRHFFFVLPFYPEGAIQFGALHRDLSPRPTLAAILTAVRVLGQGRFLGTLPCDVQAAHAYVFDSGAGRVAVVWADEAADVRLPVGADRVTVVDLVGRARTVDAVVGVVHISARPAAQYVVGLGPEVEGQLAGGRRLPGALPSLHPSKMVIVGHFDGAKLDKDRNCYVMPAGKPVRLVVEAYNFDEERPAHGSVSVTVPDGWQADRTQFDVDLPPLGRQVLEVAITPSGGEPLGRCRVRVTAEFPGTRALPSVSHAVVDLTATVPTRTLSLGFDDPGKWAANTFGNGTMSIEPGPDGGVLFPIRFTAPGDRWCYPIASVETGLSWGHYQGIALEYCFSADDPGTTARVQLIEEGGVNYVGPACPATKEWKRALCLYRDMSWGSFSKPDPDGKLTLDRIAGMLVGCNTALDELTFEVRNIELVAFD